MDNDLHNISLYHRFNNDVGNDDYMLPFSKCFLIHVILYIIYYIIYQPVTLLILSHDISWSKLRTYAVSTPKESRRHPQRLATGKKTCLTDS